MDKFEITLKKRWFVKNKGDKFNIENLYTFDTDQKNVLSYF